MSTVRVSAKYIEFVHGPGAESYDPDTEWGRGYAAAVRLVEMSEGKKVIDVPLADDDLRNELKSCADLYGPDEVRGGYVPASVVKNGKRILEEIRAWERARVRQ